ncbi:MAG: IclR family transcriptional regulator [Granulosicoccus sp.]
MSGRSKTSTADTDADVKRERAGGRAVSGLARAIRLLDLIVAEGPLRFAQIEELSEIPKASLHRLLNELADERLVQFDERVLTWSAGYRVLEMANSIWTRSDIRVLARDQLLALNALSGESVQIAVLADTHGVVIDHVESTRSVRHSINVGNREPVYCTGTGKVLLAWCDKAQRESIVSRISFARFTPNTITDKSALSRELSLISKRGYAIDAEERFLGTCCIAAPIVDATGQAVAGLSITAPAFRTSAEDLQNWRDSLMAAAAEVSRRLAPRTGPSISIAH